MAENQVRDDFFELVRLVDREDIGTNSLDLEPVTAYVYACETLVLGPWQLLAPFGAQGSPELCAGDWQATAKIKVRQKKTGRVRFKLRLSVASK